MAREYFCAYHSYRAWMEMLTDAEKGRLFDALLAYSETGELLSLGGREAALFPAMKWNIDRDKKAYEERCETNRKNGANGSNRTRTPPTATERPPIAPQIKGKGKGEREGKGKGEIESPSGNRERFAPPTVSDVAAYCQERGNTVDPQRFVDFYASKGWRVGSQPMKDWKAAVRTWERREPPQGQRRKSFAEIAEELDKEGL